MLTCSSVTGSGLDEVWQAVLDHRAHLESGAEGLNLAERRAHQQEDWMWAMVDAQLQDAVRSSPSVRAEREKIARSVHDGRISAVDGTARILELYAADLRELPARPGGLPGVAPATGG